ncbi:hypothetical protein SteCoe_634 [Stentor coeruleus]|uniref:Uncharacterized protein n=1 Tax=Stentor coeruleus TaxID=5963 RepID=A0A1R2D3R9_9CILI|nr:hypothetical protein SteCoe_634 [Stentor coeruleus]
MNRQKKKPTIKICPSFVLESGPQSKSCQNSPRIFSETGQNGFPCFPSIKEEFQYPCKSISDIKLYNEGDKVRALEEIGLFSEFKTSKSKAIKTGSSAKNFRRGTIYITDFMMEGSKKTMLKKAGGLDLYLEKRRRYEKEQILHDANIRNFFEHTEKKPEFFFSHPSSPIISMKMSSPHKKMKTNLIKVPNIDNIIDKCNKAIMIKPPKINDKPLSNRANTANSKNEIKRMKFAYLNNLRSL